MAPKYQTDERALSWYRLVTYLGVGRCAIYTPSGPLALGYVNHAASYTSVCNLYIYTCHFCEDKRTQPFLSSSVCADDGTRESCDEYSDVTINIRELDDVLMKDVGNKISQSGKYKC